MGKLLEEAAAEARVVGTQRLGSVRIDSDLRVFGQGNWR